MTIMDHSDRVVNQDGTFNIKINPNRGMSLCARIGLEHGVMFYIDRGADDFNEGMYVAAYNGHQKIVGLMISKGGMLFNDCMCVAAYSGYKGIVELMITHGANAWRRAIICAVRGTNDTDILRALYEKFFDTYFSVYSCSVCNDENPNGLVISKCSHVFHRTCIAMLDACDACPVCKKLFDGS